MANLKAVLTRPKVSENYSRNAFDRSCSPKLTYQLGGLQPFFAEPFIAGSHVKLNRSIFQRTAAVNSPAFPTVDTHCEFFYVPIRLLMTNFESWKLNINDVNSSLQYSFDGSGSPSYDDLQVPSFNILDVKANIAAVLSNQTGGLKPYFTTKTAAAGANRLLDSLGYGFVDPTDSGYTSEADVDTFLVNPFKLAAYQKIYFDHFRNTAYEANSPASYNLDYFARPNQRLDSAAIRRLTTYRYVNYRKDYFQSVYPSLNQVNTSPTGRNWTLPNSFPFVRSVPGNTAPYDSQQVVGDLNGQVLLQSPSNSNGLSISTLNQIRAAFALDKLMRASAYAPKHVKDQFEARFGVKGVEANNESVRIGAMMNTIVFQEVTNTAANLGEVGGKGIGSSGFEDDIEFTCKEDCIIMGLMYSLPRSSYDSYFFRNWNCKLAREEFFNPEYMNLGLQPLLSHEVRLLDNTTQNNGNNLNFIVGYQSRYQEYKCGIDINHGLFNNGQALSDFVVHSNRTYGALATNGVNSNYFKVKPTDMDSIFAQTTDPTDINTDKFITYLDVKCICNQNMSVHGMFGSIS